MARQNSKYFSSVIEKLIADKHKENIVIDQGFKARLREDVLARAKIMDVPESNVNTGVGEFFARWKYVLAFVPSALLVVVVAAQLMNVPVEMGSDVVVPQGTGVEENNDEAMVGIDEDKEIEVVSDLEGEDSERAERAELSASVLDAEKVDEEGVGEIDDTGSNQTIKTFPGSLVMPGDRSDSVSELNFDGVYGGGTGSDKSAESAVAGILVSPAKEDVADDSVRQGVVGEPLMIPDQVVTARSYVYESEDEEFEYIDRDENVFDDSSNLKIVNTGGLKVVESGTVEGDGIGGGELEENDVIGGGEGSEDEIGDDREESLVPKTTPMLMDVPVKSAVDVPKGGLEIDTPVSSDSYRVSYETSLSDLEEQALRENVLYPLDSRQNVERFVVVRNEDGYVEVTTYFENGSRDEQVLNFNPDTGLWDEVTYVESGYRQTPFVYKTYQVEY